MKYIAIICTLLLGCFAGPVIQKETLQQAPPSKLASFAYALDLSSPVTVTGFSCMRASLYSVVFIRGYSPAGSGTVDPYACANIQNANKAGLGTEVFMTPQPNSAKTGAQQFDEMYNNLRNSNINVRAVWIQVTSPINWSLVTINNVNFLNSILSRARQYGITVGIYTNYYDWSQITNGAMVSNVMLWYWNVYGGGPQNETPADFSDFRQFGGWTVPSVKQFAQVESVCGVTVNRNVYTTSSAAKGMATMAKSEKPDEITVGGLLLGNAAKFTGKPEIIA
nr:Protein LYS-2 [Haemonchus contortus]